MLQSWKVRPKKVGMLENWKVGMLESAEVGKLSPKKLASWKLGKSGPESWKVSVSCRKAVLSPCKDRKM